MMRLLLAALFIETGIVLAVVPWSSFWERNYFAESVPLLHAIITNNFVRGAVSGLGFVNLLAGAAELLSMLVRRFHEPIITTISPSSPVEDR